MRYQVMLIESEEGYSVSCPSLPGCASQGETEEEALDNIREAIADYKAVMAELHQAEDTQEFVYLREIEVAA